MNKLAIVSIIGLGMIFSGCVISVGDDGYTSGSKHHKGWKQTEHENREKIANLATNKAYQGVISEMGVADFSENYERNGEQVTILFYRTQRQDDDGITTKNECTPLVFVNDLLVGWGDSAVDRVR